MIFKFYQQLEWEHSVIKTMVQYNHSSIIYYLEIHACSTLQAFIFSLQEHRAETGRRYIHSLLPHLLLLLNKRQIAVIDREIAQSE